MRRRSLLFALLVACGHGESPPPEPPDCLSFCEPPPPPTGPISVVITHGVPVVGHEVIFVDTLGRVTFATTDSTGRAMTQIERGATVTVVNPFGVPTDGVDDVRTLTDARPFDQLDLRAPGTDPITVTVTAPTPPVQAASFELRTSCGNATLAALSGQVTLRGCTSVADMLWLALDANGAPLRSIDVTLDVFDGASIVLPNEYDVVPETRIEYIGADGFEITGRVALQAPRGSLYSRDFVAPIASGSGTGRALLPRAPGALSVVESRLTPGNGDVGVHGVFDWNPPSTGLTQFVSLGSDLMPSLTSAPSVSQNFIQWSEAAFAAPMLLESSVPDVPPIDDHVADYVVFDLELARGAKQWRWRVIAKRNETFLELPQLPNDFNVQTGDTVVIKKMLLVNVPGTYDNVRHTLLTNHAPEGLILDSFSGRIVFQELR